MKAPTLRSNVVTEFPVSLLVADPLNPRTDFDQKSLAELSKSIGESGIHVPLLVRKDGKAVIVLDGERCLRVAKLAKLKTVPVLLSAAEGDAADRQIAQVVINNQRQALKPLELAAFLVKLRDEQKLTSNEIASRLEKAGMKAMSRSQVANMIRLVDLPAFAKDMVDAGTLEITAARGILTANDHKDAQKLIERSLASRVQWSGRATVKDVDSAIAHAFSDTAMDLKRNWGENAPRFDYRKVCKGCEHLKEYGGGAWCLNRKGFDEHQQQAIEAGLDVGGKKIQKSGKPSKDKPLTPAQQRAAEKQKVQQRTEQLERNSETYLHDWCRARLLASWSELQGTWRLLIDFIALGAPGLNSWELDRRIGRNRRRFLRIAAELEYPNLGALLQDPKVGREALVGYEQALSRQILELLPWPETRWLAQHVYGQSLKAIWHPDADYLGLLRKAELAAIAETHCPAPEGGKAWSTRKVDEIVAAILAVADQIGPPPDLSELYSATDPERVIDLQKLDDLESDDEPDDEDLEEAA